LVSLSQQCFNPLQCKDVTSNNNEVGTLAVDGWAVTFGTAMWGLGGSGEATGGGCPPLSSGATHGICAEPMRKYWGTPSTRNGNVVPAIVLVVHLVTFSESQ